MTNTQAIGGLELGTGRPAVCVPLTGADAEALRREAAGIGPGVADIVELRIDFLAALDALADDGAGGNGVGGNGADEGAGASARAAGAESAVADAVVAVRSALPDGVPVLFTFRSTDEGGQRSLSPDALDRVVAAAIGAGGIDAVDVEQFGDARARLVDRVHAAGLPVVMSSHEFERTPDRATIVDRLADQQSLGADVVKFACMPQNAADVFVLLAATEEFVRERATRPAITMAMGPLGVVSRLSGEVAGSVLTFGTVGAASAPGQVDAVELRRSLELVHGAQGD